MQAARVHCARSRGAGCFRASSRGAGGSASCVVQDARPCRFDAASRWRRVLGEGRALCACEHVPSVVRVELQRQRLCSATSQRLCFGKSRRPHLWGSSVQEVVHWGVSEERTWSPEGGGAPKVWPSSVQVDPYLGLRLHSGNGAGGANVGPTPNCLKSIPNICWATPLRTWGLLSPRRGPLVKPAPRHVQGCSIVWRFV